jgi:hypothetical protein
MLAIIYFIQKNKKQGIFRAKPTRNCSRNGQKIVLSRKMDRQFSECPLVVRAQNSKNPSWCPYFLSEEYEKERSKQSSKQERHLTR